jgi:hypothetical protein
LGGEGGRTAVAGGNRVRHKLRIAVYGTLALAFATPAVTWQVLFGERSTAKEHDQGDNGLWLRRHWLHGGTDTSAERLSLALQALGVKRIYPFLGPMDGEGWPGWRDDQGLATRYDPAVAATFFDQMARAAPGVVVLPWTGGVLRRDVRLEDEAQRAGFAAHTAQLTALGAGGVHVNVEPLPDGSRAYLELLREVKGAIGPGKVLSVAAYPPTTPLHPVPDVHWSLSYAREVCQVADELVFMAYDTGASFGVIYETQVAVWTRDLVRELPPPGAGGCTWSMGVPTYDDDEPWHDPQVETLGRALIGVQRGLGDRPVPPSFRGVTLYASWTTSPREWAVYDRGWRGKDATGVVVPDHGDGD